MMGFGFLGLLLLGGVLIALLGGGATLVTRGLTSARTAGGSALSTARQILAERLARGEITPEEYDLVLARQVMAYLDNTPADLIVAQDGVTNLLSATSLFPGSVEDQADV